jgi:hypothetical protein
MGVFPIFLLMGRLWRYPWAGPPVFVASIMLLAVATTLFVIGHWAF